MIFGRHNATPERPATANLLGSLLLVVDGSEPSMEAARFAMNLAKQVGSRVTAVYVVDTATMDYLMQMRIFVTEERNEFEADIERTGRRYLEYVATIGRKQAVETETLQIKGRFHTVILQEARALHVDAIVLGGWRRSATRKDTTSVERQLVLDLADCPVIVVKSASEHETEGDD